MSEACPPHSSADIVANMTASTVAQYLAALPADRRAALSAVRKVINRTFTFAPRSLVSSSRKRLAPRAVM